MRPPEGNKETDAAQANSLPAALVFYMGTGSSPSYSISNPAAYLWPGNAAKTAQVLKDFFVYSPLTFIITQF